MKWLFPTSVIRHSSPSVIPDILNRESIFLAVIPDIANRESIFLFSDGSPLPTSGDDGKGNAMVF